MTMHRRGFSLLELIVVVAIMGVLAGMILGGVQSVRAATDRAACLNNMRQLSLGLVQYHDTHKHFPPGHTNWFSPGQADNFVYLGWPARILPFIERGALWADVVQAFSTDPEPDGLWNHPAHWPIFKTVVATLGCPTDDRVRSSATVVGCNVAFTSYLGVSGTDQHRHNGILFAASRTVYAEVRDGASNTLILGERPPNPDLHFGWWYRGVGQSSDGSCEMLMGAREINMQPGRYPCASGRHEFGPSDFDDPCGMYHFWSPHRGGGAHFGFADGSVRFLRYSAVGVLPALATRAGGEVVAQPD
jgi:prepilin-type N-terminal cleavage/methylation domain-containing protein/prepilin-type processing-associated H-X9-DG protein